MYIKRDNSPKLSQLDPRSRARARVKALTNRVKYQSYINSGMEPEQAARMIGIKVPFGQRISAKILRKVLEPEKEGF